MGKGGDDAELRHRRGSGGTGDCAEASATLKHDAEKNVLAKLDSQHICVDGIVYALGSFPKEHPGGESIAMFGGSDCTVHYRMIHPYVTQEASCRAPWHCTVWLNQRAWSTTGRTRTTAALCAAVWR